MTRHYRGRPRIWIRLGCTGCSIPLLGAIIAIVALIVLTGCGSGAGAAHHASCLTQYQAWQQSPARALAKTFATDLQKANAAASIQDIPRLAAALKTAGHDATALQAYPMPHCADPAGYWHQGLAGVRAAADNANAGSGLGALMTAMGPGQKAQATFGKLGAELQRTVPAALTH
jgi:hypothetical protein